MSDREQNIARLTEELNAARQRIAELEMLKTEKRQVRKALRESEEKFKAIFRRSPIAILVYDAEGTLSDANPAALRTFGVRQFQDIKGINLFDNPRLTAEHREQICSRQVVRFQSIVDFDNIRRLGFYEPTKSGVAHLDWIIIPFRQSGYLVQIQDITHRVQAMSALRENEERFRLLAENAKDLIYRLRLQPNQAFEYVSPSATAITGYTPEEHYADPNLGFKLVHPDDRPILQSLLDGGGMFGKPIVLRWKRKDGTILWTEQRNVPVLDDSGELVAIEGVARDITERKEAEKVLARQAQELARSNAELEQFAYIASHDLQEPLRKILAFGDRLKTKYETALDEQGRDYLERMQSAATRMRYLINALLNYSRVTTKGQPFTRVDLGEVVQEVLSILELRIEQSGGQVTVGKLPIIDADPLQMQLLFQNLISNALKFRQQDQPPVVKIHSRTNDPSGQDSTISRESITLYVQDNGIGFAEKYQERIFGPFQRLHGRDTYEGTGMGLAIVRKIVERHGGTIRAQAAPGEGATFIVTLPCQQARDTE
jgi:PAS domain S-box-containing protein